MRNIINIEELLQDGGGLPDVTQHSSCVADWSRILMDALSDLTNQLWHYRVRGNHKQVKRCLLKIEAICALWRTRLPKE